MADRRAASRHLGLDLGGTNIKWVVAECDGTDWHVLDQAEVATPVGGPDVIVPRLASVGAEAILRCPGVTTVGVGVPGLYDPSTGTTRFLVNVPGAWDGRPVGAEIEQALGLPVRLINDARAFGVAELRLGAGRDVTSMVGFTLGTGVGGVFAVGDRVHQGHDGTGGELGHQTIEPDGPWCGCGNRGCLEAYARADQIAATCGASSAEEAVERARAGDARALAGIEQVGRYLGIGIANMVVIVNPGVVVLGGGVAAAIDLLIGPINDELRRRVHVTSLEGVRIVPAELGKWGGAIGAAIHGSETGPTAGPPETAD